MNVKEFVDSLNTLELEELDKVIVYKGKKVEQKKNNEIEILLETLENLYTNKHLMEVNSRRIDLYNDDNYDTILQMKYKILIDMYQDVNANSLFEGVCYLKVFHLSNYSITDLVQLLYDIKKDSLQVGRVITFIIDITQLKRFQLDKNNCIYLEEE